MPDSYSVNSPSLAKTQEGVPAPGNARENFAQSFLNQPLAQWIAIGVGVALLLFLVYALVRKRKRRRQEFADHAERPSQPLMKDKPPQEAPPSQAPEVLPTRRRERLELETKETESEIAARMAEQQAENARLEAKRLLEKSRQLGDVRSAQLAEKARIDAELAREKAQSLQELLEKEKRQLRIAEEERKKAEYRAKKTLEAEEKERKRQEAEQKRIREEEEAREKQRQEEESRELAFQEEQKRAQIQAGKTLSEGLARTKGGFIAGLNSFLGRNKVLDESVLAELEEVLFSADIGVKTATNLLEFARDRVRAKDLADSQKLQQAIRDQILQIVSLSPSKQINSPRPFIKMVIGVNGSGKTTTIGKMAAQFTSEGRRVLLAAGDTFRAAAAEQLEIWGERAQAPVVKGKEGGDPGAVVFDAVKRACSENFDVLMIDTAGRLHTKAPLMEELKRVKRVIGKALSGAPHEVLLVLDSTNGQNAIAQAREFHSALEVDGIILTKLDGTAKGGVIIGICDELKVPVRFIGIGETVGDLRPFDSTEFVKALFE